MKRFGWAIRTGGDREIAGALAAGIERATTGAPNEAGRAFAGRAEEAVRRVAMMRHTPEEWAEMTEEARVFYGGQRYTPRWIERLQVGWAMVCMGASWLYHLQDRLLRGEEKT